MKGNRAYLHEVARDFGRYDLRAPFARTAESYRGHTIVRELYAREVADEPTVVIEAAQRLWYVFQTTTDDRGDVVAAE